MNESVIRLVVLLGAAIVVAAFWWWGNRRRADARVTVRMDLEPGVILFTSETCASCRAARKAVNAVFQGGYREVQFEDDPPGFGRLGIGRVPTVMLVSSDHQTVILEGVPSRRQLRRHRSDRGSLNG
ncbi:MAG TPA: hypothetical protein VM470_05360 [Acidimicrobiia bacterium]|nr:hypothetical protein [Acidimicrobiia bacterium]